MTPEESAALDQRARQLRDEARALRISVEQMFGIRPERPELAVVHSTDRPKRTSRRRGKLHVV
jgi:hypothetical protein